MCVKGAKGVIVFSQLEGNNIDINGVQKDGQFKSPGYNQKTGFADGAQNDIFVQAYDSSKSKRYAAVLVGFTSRNADSLDSNRRFRRQHMGKNRWH